MKQPIIATIFLFMIALCLSACDMGSLEIKKNLGKSSSKIQIPETPSSSVDDQIVIIYDITEEAIGLNIVPVSLIQETGNLKKDVINTFLKYNHFLSEKNQVSLLQIEEFGNATTFHLSSINDLGQQTNLPLFKKALELTLMRHLNSKDFNITYSETTAQL